MLIMSVGVRPETELAIACGIETNRRGSIIVDENMRTNYPDIFAVGDAVEVKNYINKQPALYHWQVLQISRENWLIISVVLRVNMMAHKVHPY